MPMADSIQIRVRDAGRFMKRLPYSSGPVARIKTLAGRHYSTPLMKEQQRRHHLTRHPGPCTAQSNLSNTNDRGVIARRNIPQQPFKLSERSLSSI